MERIKAFSPDGTPCNISPSDVDYHLSRGYTLTEKKPSKFTSAMNETIKREKEEAAKEKEKPTKETPEGVTMKLKPATSSAKR